MNKLKSFLYILIAIFISFSLVVFLPNNVNKKNINKVYRVYLNGKSLGLILSKTKLEEYINNEQQEIKENYNVNNVYIPNGVSIKEEMTYNDKILTEKKIYDTIKKTHPFTIKGYEINIKKQATTGSISEEKQDAETETIYVLDKTIFNDAVESIVTAFINTDDYNNYKDSKQVAIDDIGTLIENVYLKDSVTIKKTLISTSSTIYQDIDQLKAYLLFGKSNNEQIYIVKKGDNVDSIAANNKLSTDDLVILNSSLRNSKTLLYEGQKLNIGIISPAVTVVEETHEVTKEIVKYETEVRYNYDIMAGTVTTLQEGVNGLNKVTKKVKRENGEIVEAAIISSEEITPTVTKIVERGASYGYLIGEVGYWTWPTKKPYTISAVRGWRWGRMHNGIDITGTGHGSPIYAANDGTVVFAGYHWSFGNYIDLNHNNGYITRYAHLSKIYVRNGQQVKAGAVIGAMGSTGQSTGTHLHFEVKYDGKYINPFLLY